MQHVQEIGRQHPYVAPASSMNNQQNFSRPSIVDQQNLPGSHSHLLPTQSLDHSHAASPPMTNISGSQMPPYLPAGPYGHGQSSAGYQSQVTNLPNTSLPQSGIGSYNSAPPLPSQAIMSPTGPGLSQFESRQFAPPLSTMVQSTVNPSGPNFSQARQKPYPQTVPPLPNQTITSPTGPGLSQPGQRQYSSAPPLPGQNLSSPLGMNRAAPGVSPGYQQPVYQQPGYHNQMV